MAQTKLPGYVTIVSTFGFIYLLLPLQTIGNVLTRKEQMRSVPFMLSALLIVITLFFHFHPDGILQRHGFSNNFLRKEKETILSHCLSQIKQNPEFKGYYLLKRDLYFVHIPLLYSTEAKVLPFSEEVKQVLSPDDYRIIDCFQLIRKK